MKTKLRKLLRWGTILGFAGLGIYALVSGVLDVVHRFAWYREQGCLGGLQIFAGLCLVFIPFGLAQLAYQRRYRGLCAVLTGPLALLFFTPLLGLVVKVDRLIDFPEAENSFPLLGLFFLFWGLFSLIAPFWATRWFVRAFFRWQDRVLPKETAR